MKRCTPCKSAKNVSGGPPRATGSSDDLGSRRLHDLAQGGVDVEAVGDQRGRRAGRLHRDHDGVQEIGGVIMAPQLEATVMRKRGRLIDYFVVSEGLAHCVDVSIDVGAPWETHAKVVATVKGSRGAAMVCRLVRPTTLEELEVLRQDEEQNPRLKLLAFRTLYGQAAWYHVGQG